MLAVSPLGVNRNSLNANVSRLIIQECWHEEYIWEEVLLLTSVGLKKKPGQLMFNKRFMADPICC